MDERSPAGATLMAVAAVAAPVLGLAVALPAHYPWNLDTLGHLGLVYLGHVSVRGWRVAVRQGPAGR
jgi:hypothetical protein